MNNSIPPSHQTNPDIPALEQQYSRLSDNIKRLESAQSTPMGTAADLGEVSLADIQPAAVPQALQEEIQSHFAFEIGVRQQGEWQQTRCGALVEVGGNHVSVTQSTVQQTRYVVPTQVFEQNRNERADTEQRFYFFRIGGQPLPPPRVEVGERYGDTDACWSATPNVLEGKRIQNEQNKGRTR
ncbi:MAG: hypothetical protein EAZ74_01235 [Alphaproteobacteria bacterium]|nr:MAG: hypothetical protein EAY76_04465 [Alphaproteobacteria bacterium]TAF15637.1 MAG: hypothetical protein EAZ74_01235 [Alphaproteobacteria bacterium]TAF40024.1 MAG: hypothetical protein EAZ66_03825 [Alphaproteobacteria bacterium]TAF76200.1 MAG: hypothetical protein EAZ52_04700 [Alphaproteobacteria bacterium]